MRRWQSHYDVIYINVLINVPMWECTDVPIKQPEDVPMWECTDVPMKQPEDVPMCPPRRIPMYQLNSH